MKTGVYVLLEIFVFGLTYGGVIVIILSYLKLFQRKLNKLFVLLPLCIMGFFFILLIIFQFLGMGDMQGYMSFLFLLLDWAYIFLFFVAFFF